MSDFFSDDFTAELKSYFLTSLVAEVEKFQDLLDDKIWKRIASEISEQARAWSVDAKTNEFHFFSEWFEHYSDQVLKIDSRLELHRSLENLKAYGNTLIADRVDSAELAARFTTMIVNTKEVTFLHCRSGAQDFAIPLLNVVEISGSLPLYPLPEKSPGLMGVVPYRGEAVPVVDLQDHGFLKIDTKNAFFVVCEHGGQRFSLQVTATEDLLNLKGADLQNVEGHASIINVPFVKQFFIKNDRSVMVLDLEQLVAA